MKKIKSTGFWQLINNPARWNIQSFLKNKEKETDWRVMPRHDEVKKGQWAVIRVGHDHRTKKQLSGQEKLKRGIYAIVKINKKPSLKKKVDKPEYYYDRKDKIRKPHFRASFEIVHNLINRPILLDEFPKKNSEAYDKMLSEGIQASIVPLNKKTFKNLASKASKVYFGELSNIKEGAWYPNRKALVKDGLHNDPVKGISGKLQEGANAIVLSGGYEDDEDNWDTIKYTGWGGRDPKSKKQVKSQSFEENNHLILSYKNKYPIRVIRGPDPNSKFSPESGYRYDGLYQITSFNLVKGKSNYNVCKFNLKKIKNIKLTKIKRTKSTIINSPSFNVINPDNYLKTHRNWSNSSRDPELIKELQERIRKKHQSVVIGMSKIIKNNNLKPEYNQNIDLYCVYKNTGMIFEIKTWTNESNFLRQSRLAIGQLFVYKKRHSSFTKNCKMFLIYDQNPSKVMPSWLKELLFSDCKIIPCWFVSKKIKTFKEFQKEIKWIKN